MVAHSCKKFMGEFIATSTGKRKQLNMYQPVKNIQPGINVWRSLYKIKYSAFYDNFNQNGSTICLSKLDILRHIKIVLKKNFQRITPFIRIFFHCSQVKSLMIFRCKSNSFNKTQSILKSSFEAFTLITVEKTWSYGIHFSISYLK